MGLTPAAKNSVQIGPQPALNHRQIHPAPRGIIIHLIAADPGDAEVLAVGVREVEAGNGGGGDRMMRLFRYALCAAIVLVLGASANAAATTF